MTNGFDGLIEYSDVDGVWTVNAQGHVSSRSGAKRSRYGTQYVIPFVRQLNRDGLISGGEVVEVDD